ncbi:MAG: hypothetical protein O3A00_02395 [Planctomycetota bacterium]|nr:hypothetical protein [Planctomycetota bacterium]
MCYRFGMDAESIKDDLRDDDAPLERATAIILDLHSKLADAIQRIEELEKQIENAGSQIDTPQNVTGDYSVDGEQQRQEAGTKKARKKQKSQRRGRISGPSAAAAAYIDSR